MGFRGLPAAPHWLIPSAYLRIGLIYWFRHRRWPNLRSPRSFTELVQWRKLYDRDPSMTIRSDKVAVKDTVGAVLGADWLIPTLWSGVRLPRNPEWKFPVILKSRHGSNQTIICNDLGEWKAACRAAKGWIQRPYGLWLDEWAYRDVARGYIVEPFLSQAGKPPLDFKIYVMGGRAELVQVHLGRFSDHRWILHDRDWRQVSMFGEAPAPRPASIERMMQAAETLARQFDFARVDFYEIDGTPRFGELTFYPGSGLDPFNPPELDAQIGALWLRARKRAQDRAGTADLDPGVAI